MPPSPTERRWNLLLEMCSGCSSTVRLLNGDYEFDIARFTALGALLPGVRIHDSLEEA